MGSRSATAALIESNDAIERRVIEATGAAITAATGATVNKEYRYAIRIAGLIDV
jgi:hypothetical protein